MVSDLCKFHSLRSCRAWWSVLFSFWKFQQEIQFESDVSGNRNNDIIYSQYYANKTFYHTNQLARSDRLSIHCVGQCSRKSDAIERQIECFTYFTSYTIHALVSFLSNTDYR
uniref:AlNc14C169G7962 protein n=1 Tax=Albugo laibachii Nc14 TaxID=890382 RepID=F0WND2_9STRA|nr:AlNc14C169G7962 [Albugo laibachii Nc14]|eukprot:CCA22823.1 AlNc14C169G7962 [Albugo laibachii Nc14]